jgi:hypothetical protein
MIEQEGMVEILFTEGFAVTDVSDSGVVYMYNSITKVKVSVDVRGRVFELGVY